MGPWLAWLAKLALSPKFAKWLIEQLGPNALKLFGEWLGRIRNRQIAIDEADQIDGRFSGAIIDGKRHLVVWKDGKPISAYPPIANGDLNEKLRHHTREDLKKRDDLATQRAKRWVQGHVPTLRGDDQLDDSRFRAVLTRIEPLFSELQNSPQHQVGDHPSIPAAPGIYMFSDHGNPIYVGQSRNLRRGLAQHIAANSRENAASFAFKLAKRNARDAGVDISGSRKAIEARRDFAKLFASARKEVAEMTVQFVELEDPIERSLFEIYISLALKTDEFNSF
jgi:hypothetical protein